MPAKTALGARQQRPLRHRGEHQLGRRKVHSPLGGWYYGTKFAVGALSDCLRSELKPFGIDVVVIEPDGIQTEWGEIAAKGLLATSGSAAYAKQAAATALGRGAPGRVPGERGL